MNKKITIIASVVAVVLISAMLIFVFSTNSDEASINLTGNWQIVTSRVEGGKYELHNDGYISFNETGATYYLNGEKKESTYAIDKNNVLTLPELNKEYLVEYVSDDNLRLVPDQSKREYHTYIIRYGGETFTKESFNIDQLKGKWNLTMKATEHVAEEYIVIDDTTFSDYRNSELFVEDEYIFDESNHLKLNKISKVVSVHFGGPELMFFIETDTGYIWELHKAD